MGKMGENDLYDFMVKKWVLLKFLHYMKFIFFG